MILTLNTGEVVEVHSNSRVLVGDQIPQDVITETDLKRAILSLRIGEEVLINKGKKFTLKVQRLATVKNSKFLAYVKSKECFVPATKAG